MSTVEKTFIATAGLLLAVGLLMVYSASITSRPTEFETVYLSRQALFLGLSLLAGGTAALLPPRLWRIAAPWLLAATLLLLAAVLVPGVGTSVKGARRWLRFAGFTMQPSELAKLTLPLFVCWMAADGGWHTQSLRRTVVCVLAPLAAALGLVLCEPDLGTTLFLGMTAAVALFLSGWPLRRFLLAGAAVLPAVLGLVALRPYQWSRVQGFLATWQDFQQAPYQVRQSLTSLGAGGVWGAGLGLGGQKLSFLPEANTDFVFAVIGEELGLAGTLGVLVLWTAFYALGRTMLTRVPRGSFEHALGLTLLTSLALQAVVNMAVVVALLPPKGISLPLISYGGSNLVVSVVMVGMVIGLYRARVCASGAVQPQTAVIPAPLSDVLSPAPPGAPVLPAGTTR